MKNKVPYFFLGLAAALAIAAFALLLLKIRETGRQQSQQVSTSTAIEAKTPPLIPGNNTPLSNESTEEILKNLGIGLSASDPAELLTRIGAALEKGDIAAVSKIIGKDALDAVSLENLRNLTKAHPLTLRRPDGVREVGELELNRLTRWAIELEETDDGGSRIFFDLRKKGGQWFIEKMMLPSAPGEPIPKAMLADSLGVADAFLQAILKEDFEFALQFADLKVVSEAKIATLCILFEEGEYRLRSQKPLRSMFKREDTVGYLANVETKDGKQSAQFSMNLRQPAAPANWIVSEINLDALLADYANRVAGGDVYYSPLVKNPAGGETLALYFEFDEDSMSARTRRQLEIVALMLKSDAGKKITVSGHTDALGTADYNAKLSENRADTVRSFLASKGVSANQIVTLAEGASQPRRPNFTESGADDPDGRRANRRTEIYLDF